jgi:hypothetical protein
MLTRLPATPSASRSTPGLPRRRPTNPVAPPSPHLRAPRLTADPAASTQLSLVLSTQRPVSARRATRPSNRGELPRNHSSPGRRPAAIPALGRPGKGAAPAKAPPGNTRPEREYDHSDASPTAAAPGAAPLQGVPINEASASNWMQHRTLHPWLVTAEMMGFSEASLDSDLPVVRDSSPAPGERSRRRQPDERWKLCPVGRCSSCLSAVKQGS